MTAPERILAPEVSRLTGLPLRTVQHLAKSRKIPSAAQLGSRWTFDPLTIRRWIKQQEAMPCLEISTDAAASGGAANRLPEPSVDEAYARAIGLKPRGATRAGQRN